MSLDRPEFYIFFLAVLIFAIWLSPSRRWMSLLVANILILFSLNFSVGLIFLILAVFNFHIVKAANYEKIPFYLSLFLNLSFLFFFKYLNFFLPAQNTLIKEIVLPVGISFFVFQQLSYLIDVRRRKSVQVNNLGQYLTYTFLFANFTTGPIERANNIINQLQSINIPQKSTVRMAAIFIFWGLFKVLAVADNINPYVTKVFYSKGAIAEDILPAILLNKYEIYANFSGYTDVALGIGLLLGINFTVNFKRPFSALTITDYWKRWHLSLSYWIRDYIFFPLSLSPLSRLGVYPVMLITFMVFAIWHDLRITFLVYPFIQVFLIFLSNQSRPFIEQLQKNYPNRSLWIFINFLRRIWVYVILLSVPAIFFRAETMGKVGQIFKSLSELSLDQYLHFLASLFGSCFFVFCLVIFTEAVEWFREKYSIHDWLERQSYMLEVGCYLFALLLFLLLAKFGSTTGFIYSKY